VENYSDYGPLRQFLPGREQSQQVWGVFDRTGEKFNIEAGFGVGVTAASDKLTLKFMISRDLN
jgi:hypothetical protein